MEAHQWYLGTERNTPENKNDVIDGIQQDRTETAHEDNTKSEQKDN